MADEVQVQEKGEVVKRKEEGKTPMTELDHFVKSGYFADARDVSKAVVKVAFGKQLGLPPAVAMTSIIIIQGKPTLSAGGIAALIKKSGRYRWTIDQLDAKVCTITVFEKVDTGPNAWEWFKHSPFTRRIEDYAFLAAKNPTWKQFPRNMLYSRTISDIGKMLCPEIFLGSIYTPDEIPSDDVKVDGATLEVTSAPDLYKAPAKQVKEESLEAEFTVVANEDDVAAVMGELSAENLGMAWARKALGAPGLEAAEMSPQQVEKLRKCLATYRQAK